MLENRLNMLKYCGALHKPKGIQR